MACGCWETRGGYEIEDGMMPIVEFGIGGSNKFQEEDVALHLLGLESRIEVNMVTVHLWVLIATLLVAALAGAGCLFLLLK